MSDGGSVFDALLQFKTDHQSLVDAVPNVVNGTALTGQSPSDFATASQTLLDSIRQGVSGTVATGAAAADIVAAANGQRQSVAALQSTVNGLVTNDISVAGVKIQASADGTSTTWGSDWTTSGTSPYHIKTDISSFAWDVQSSGVSIDQSVDGYFNTKTSLTDYVTVSGVFLTAAQSFNGGNGPTNTFTARRNSAGTAYIFARVFYNQVQLGYCVSGTETVWQTATGVSTPAGALVELQCGTSAGSRNYEVRVNGAAVIDYTESGTSSQLGSTYRYGGQQMMAKKNTFGSGQTGPAEIRTWGMIDSNVATVTYGSSARFARHSTSGVSYTKGAQNAATTNVFDTTDYCSSDIALEAGGLCFWTPGRYAINFVVHFSAAQTSGMASALWHNQTVGGVSLYADGVNYSAASVQGLEGHFVINAIGDGDVTEAWAPALDLPGSGSLNVVGEGTGALTWLEVTRIA